MAKAEILIIDDDKELAMITRDMLEDYGHPVSMAQNAGEAYHLLETQTFKLILLDINLPDETGFEFCQELRKYSTVPILFISARTSENDRITGLDLGADDYLPKPYSLQELLSRINANLRRAYGFTVQEKSYSFGGIELDVTARKVTKNGTAISLALKEFDLLKYLVEHKNRALKKETLLSEVWGTYSLVELSTVAVHIRWLREKLEEDPANPQFIKTVWGVGYTLEDGVSENET